MEQSVHELRLYSLLGTDARKPSKYKLPVDNECVSRKI